MNKRISLIIFIFLFFKTSSFCQEHKFLMPSDVHFIGIQKIDTPFFVTFYPSLICIIVSKHDLILIEKDTSYQSAILKSGFVFLYPCLFEIKFQWYSLVKESLKGRQDSLVFVDAFELIKKDCNSTAPPFDFGTPIIDNQHMVVKRIFYNNYFVGLIRTSLLTQFYNHGQRNYDIPGLTNIYLKFVVPIRDYN